VVIIYNLLVLGLAISGKQFQNYPVKKVKVYFIVLFFILMDEENKIINIFAGILSSCLTQNQMAGNKVLYR